VLASDPVEEAVKRLVERELGADATQHRISVSVGQLDPRVRLTPCERAEPFVPPGSRLWGRGQVGIRCTSGASWMVRLPVNVQVFASVPVAVQPLSAGAVIAATDFRLEEAELTREQAPLVSDPATLVGRQLTRPVAAGHAFRVDSVRVPPSVNAGRERGSGAACPNGYRQGGRGDVTRPDDRGAALTPHLEKARKNSLKKLAGGPIMRP
jgi:flagella basal body P-ring formation protein FlgA